VIDDVNREALTMEIELSLPAEHVVRALDQVIERRGKPKLMSWVQKHGIRLGHIQPGKPQQNA
jgi:putative transposase